MRDAEPTAEESRFFGELSTRIPVLMDWYYEDADGSLWMIISHDFVVSNVIRDTLRLDYDGRNLRGGWSPAYLNWDDGVRAADAGIDTGPPDGLHVDNVSRESAVQIAAEWFIVHIAKWDRSGSSRRGRRRSELS
jgi:hypothetical protein